MAFATTISMLSGSSSVIEAFPFIK
jgi:hypothetical protein